MAPKKSRLEAMASNPKGDWRINDISALCAEHGLELQEPSSGSHYKVVSQLIDGHLTVPYNRPIKAFYIRSLVSYVQAHIQCAEEQAKKAGSGK